MKDEHWINFFLTCAKILRASGSDNPQQPQSWCTWTTLSKLEDDLLYWRAELPELKDIDEVYIKDGGKWGQPFRYSELAHVVIPAKFKWCYGVKRNWKQYQLSQNIPEVSVALKEQDVPHRLTDKVLEIKLY